MPVYTSLATSAVCEYCGASCAHASSFALAEEHLVALGWTFREISSGTWLAACPDLNCKAELVKAGAR